MFRRDGEEILTFRVYDSAGNCISEFIGTMSEWQHVVAPVLVRSKIEPDKTYMN
jgi:hypothetical protein